MKMEQSVPKRRHIKFRSRGITQKKTYIQNCFRLVNFPAALHAVADQFWYKGLAMTLEASQSEYGIGSYYSPLRVVCRASYLAATTGFANWFSLPWYPDVTQRNCLPPVSGHFQPRYCQHLSMLGGPNPVTSALPHKRTSSSSRSKSIWLPAGRVTWSGKTTCLLGVLVSKLLPLVVCKGKMRHTELSSDMWHRVVWYKSTDVSGGSCFFSRQCSSVCPPWRRRQQDLLKRRYSFRPILGKRAPVHVEQEGCVGSRAGRDSFTKEFIFFPFPRTEHKACCLVTIPAVVLCESHSMDNMRSGSYSYHSTLKG